MAKQNSPTHSKVTIRGWKFRYNFFAYSDHCAVFINSPRWHFTLSVSSDPGQSQSPAGKVSPARNKLGATERSVHPSKLPQVELE